MLPAALGHRAGVEAMREIIRMSSDLGIRVLTLYALSTENWTRPQEEVSALLALMLECFAKETEELHRKNVRIRIIGDVEGLPEAQREAANKAMARTRDNTGLTLCVAINYGGRAEIVRAARVLAQKAVSGELRISDIDESALERELYTGGLPGVDLMIRTSGEQRLSNFLLYQCAYAEFVFESALWPDFNVDLYRQALCAYQARTRRFGGRT